MFGAARALHWRDKRVFPALKRVGNPLKPLRDWDRGLKLFSVNEEFLVSASHKLALITSLPFVHTARRYYRLNGLVRSSDWSGSDRKVASRFWEDDQTWSFRGSKSRNKVSVGEPAEGSLSYCVMFLTLQALFALLCTALLSNKTPTNPYLRWYGRVPTYVFHILSGHCCWPCGVKIVHLRE
jgi:hypothetical protein